MRVSSSLGDATGHDAILLVTDDVTKCVGDLKFMTEAVNNFKNVDHSVGKKISILPLKNGFKRMVSFFCTIFVSELETN